MSKISNTLTMLELLSNNRKYSVKEIAEILEDLNEWLEYIKQI